MLTKFRYVGSSGDLRIVIDVDLPSKKVKAIAKVGNVVVWEREIESVESVTPDLCGQFLSFPVVMNGAEVTLLEAARIEAAH